MKTPFVFRQPAPGLALLTCALALPAAPALAQAEQALPEVLVTAAGERQEGAAESGYRNRTATAGPLGRMPLQDTPYAINVTSSELFGNRGAHTVSEALKTNPTVATLMESGGYTSMSRVMVRGFTAADQSDLRDGLGDRSFAFVPLENVERIEVLNGLSSFLHGFSALGGTVNYVGKQPTAAPYASLAGGVYGGGIDYLHGDLGGPVGDDGRWGYRINAYAEHGGGHVEGSRQRRGLVAAVIDFRPTAGTRFFADAWQQDLHMTGLLTYINVDPAAGIPVPHASRFDPERQYGQDWSYNKAHKTLAGLGVESALNETFTLRAAYRRGDMWRDYQYVGATLTDKLGNYSEQAVGSTRQTEQTYSGHALLDAVFRTGAIGHRLTVGYTMTDFDYTRGEDVRQALGLSSIAAPVRYAQPGLAIGPTTTWSVSRARSWIVGDRLEFGPAWAALVGLNRASSQLRRWGSASALSNQGYRQEKTTPSVALMYKPLPAATVYASYMEGLAEGGTAPAAAANANAVLEPGRSRQHEIGVKAAVGRMDLTAAWFRIDKINEYTDPRDNVYKQDGREVHQGLELTAAGRLSDRLTLVGGLTAMDVHVARARNNPALTGKIPVNVPERQARLYLEYALPAAAGLTVTGGVNHSGRRPVDALNTQFLDGATTCDLGLRYQTRVAGRDFSLNLNVSNLFDKVYWTYYRSGDGLLLGAPRLASATARLEF